MSKDTMNKAPYREWLKEFKEKILPLRHAADDGDISYVRYDDAYNQHLEWLHQLVEMDVEGEK